MKVGVEQLHWFQDKDTAAEAIKALPAGIPHRYGWDAPHNGFYLAVYTEVQEAEPADLDQFSRLPLPHGCRWTILEGILNAS